MPAFGDALTRAQIAAVVGYVRRFCGDDAWPRGDLNFPRAFFTEKAFPENEVVLTNTVSTSGRPSSATRSSTSGDLARATSSKWSFPWTRPRAARRWQIGLGDVAFAFRRTVFASRRTGTIAAAGGEVAFPTGEAERGLGDGYHVFEPFAMFGQALTARLVLQFHAGLEIPSDPPTGGEGGVCAGGNRLQPHGRPWLRPHRGRRKSSCCWAGRPATTSEWDVVPQLQVSLSKIQHVMVAGGVRVAAEPTGRAGQRRHELPAVGLVRRTVHEVLEIAMRTSDLPAVPARDVAGLRVRHGC